MILFPPAPRRLRRDYLRRPLVLSAACVGAIALLAVVGGLLAWLFTTGLRHEQAIWAHGVPASHAEYEGIKRRDSYELNVTYIDQAGRLHRGRSSFDSMRSIDERREPEVRYDPENPDEFALNVAIDPPVGRWASAVAYGGAAPVLMAICLMIMTSRANRAVRVARRCAADGKLVVLDLVFPQPFVLRNGKARYDYVLTRADGSMYRDAADLDADRAPLHVAGRLGSTQVLALESPRRPGAVLMLAKDLYPLDVTAEEAERIAREAYDATPGAYR